MAGRLAGRSVGQLASPSARRRQSHLSAETETAKYARLHPVARRLGGREGAAHLPRLLRRQRTSHDARPQLTLRRAARQLGSCGVASCSPVRRNGIRQTRLPVPLRAAPGRSALPRPPATAFPPSARGSRRMTAVCDRHVCAASIIGASGSPAPNRRTRPLAPRLADARRSARRPPPATAAPRSSACGSAADRWRRVVAGKWGASTEMLAARRGWCTCAATSMGSSMIVSRSRVSAFDSARTWKPFIPRLALGATA